LQIQLGLDGSMQASVVIPVWNGASVIADCLDSVYAQAGDELLEVICVDNASADESAGLIAERYPHVRLIRQPVNLGFAGGINAGIDVARGNVFVLLNQDCVAHDGWLAALIQALQKHPQFGIVGCTIFNPDATLNHAGAMIRRPDAYGVHLTDVGDGQLGVAEFVTGAAVAFHRHTWDTVGRFDEGFYPGYYEDSDYCYRARRKGIETAYVPEARVTHLFSSQELQADPVKYVADQHRARYRFVSKHFDIGEVSDFFDAEYAALEDDGNLNQVIGRVVAARHTVRNLVDILERRRVDLGDTISAAHRCQLQVGFARVGRESFRSAERLSLMGMFEPPVKESQEVDEWVEGTIKDRYADTSTASEAVLEGSQELQALQQREHDLLARIFFRSAADEGPESRLHRLFRLLVLRPLSFLIGRDYLLLSELNTVHIARMDQLEHMAQVQRAQVVNRMQQNERRLKLLETLVEHDNR
jgi:GT2 family glycosyltransferase